MKMKPIITAYIILSSLVSLAKNSIETKCADEIFLADPTIFHKDGKYYLTGTGTGYTKASGFMLMESENLADWNIVLPDSMILRQGLSTYGDKGFWAPQILEVDQRYWLTYTANEQTAIAYSDKITGPFTQDSIRPIDDSEKNIDSFLFKDDDGKWYLYHVRFDNGNFLWVAEFNPATGEIVKETLTRCFRNDQPWEATPAYECVPIMEGPTVIKLDGVYYLFYSANHFESIDYAVGYAVARSPLGPWQKNPNNPIIHRDIVGENGSGHGDIFKDAEGNYRYVFHVHHSDKEVSPRRTRIITLNFDKDESTGLYSITADKSTLIIPTH